MKTNKNMGLIEFTVMGEEMLQKEVKKFGDSAHISIGKKYIGRQVKVIIQ